MIQPFKFNIFCANRTVTFEKKKVASKINNDSLPLPFISLLYMIEEFIIAFKGVHDYDYK